MNKNAMTFFVYLNFVLYRHQSILKTPVGLFGIAAVTVVSLCKFRKKKLNYN